jgi:sulfane dehydrogenase subunit SoxC
MRRLFRSHSHQAVAANGLLDRRLFLRGGAGAALAFGGIVLPDVAASSEPLRVEPWMKVPGSPFVGYGQPSRYESEIVRVATNPPNAPGTGAARTPLHRLNGIITPNGLHFERSHSGIPDIDPDAHRLLIHGLVKRPLVFTLEALSRYPWNHGSPSSNVGAIACSSIRRMLHRSIARHCMVWCRAPNGPA